MERHPAIVTIAAIVLGADTDRQDLTPESAGLHLDGGLRDLSPDHHEVLRHGFVIYDALYAWGSKRRDEGSRVANGQFEPRRAGGVRAHSRRP